jgi:CheY-like chemotaxis protein
MNDHSRLNGVRVLVVDDTRSILDVVTDMLKHNGAEVTAVGTAEEALDVLQRERPDVLLSDLSMPGKSGYWLIGQCVH